jgi:uncharacterized protein
VTPRLTRMARCYRCLHEWQMRRRRSRFCPRCKSRQYDVPVVRPLRLGRGSGIEEIIGPHRAKLLEIARESGIEGLWVFGSVRRRDARQGSDVDLLVTWKRPASLLTFAGVVDRMSTELGRRVELVDRDALHWAIAPAVLAEAVPL